MAKFWRSYGWILKTIAGSSVFAAGFACFLLPGGISTGGISGLALVIRELLGFGSVGSISIVLNLPLFVLGGWKIGGRFFAGSLLGMLLSSGLIDAFAGLHLPAPEPILGILYGGTLCGLGLGLVFSAGASTGGSDILVRLFKLRWRSVPIGQIAMGFDALVVMLTGLVFQDVDRALYTGITVYLCGRMVDAVVYRFDYSQVALIISREHEAIAQAIGEKLDRGATFLHGQGSYSREDTKVVLVALRRQQIAQLKELVTDLDASAFIIVQEAHQVLGDGFGRYSKHAL